MCIPLLILIYEKEEENPTSQMMKSTSRRVPIEGAGENAAEAYVWALLMQSQDENLLSPA